MLFLKESRFVTIIRMMARGYKTKITKNDVRHMAGLARLFLDKEEIRKFQEQLSDTLDYIAILNKLNTGNCEPTSQVTGLENVFRDDVVAKTPISIKQTLDSTSESYRHFYKVKGVIEK